MGKGRVGSHPEAEVIRETVGNLLADPLERRKWNVDGTLPPTTPDEFWEWLVLSLLSSQQKYSKDSPCWRLENGIDPFPMPLAEFASIDEAQINERLARFRFHKRITNQLLRNHHWLFIAEGWNATVQPLLASLLAQRNSPPTSEHADLERQAARMLDQCLEGVGPKQARNLLQSLGLTRYELPLDSRVVGWLQSRLGWSIRIEALTDPQYYEDLLDRVQASCASAGVLPTLFDAAVFDEVGRGKMPKATPTTCTGYVNRNGQVVVRNTRIAGTDKNQYVYQLACSHCGHTYGANGSDIHDRKCPQCQDGRPGLDLE